jgi:hypothetical protein
METTVTDLYRYLKDEMEEGKIDFAFRVVPTDVGIDLTIHPMEDGETIDISIFSYDGTDENLDLATKFMTVRSDTVDP